MLNSRDNIRRIFLHIASAFILIMIVLAGAFIFRDCYLYLINAFKELWLQFAVMFCKIFNIPNDIKVDITKIPVLPEYTPPIPPFNPGTGGGNIIPEDFDVYSKQWEMFRSMLSTIETYKIMYYDFIYKLGLISKVILMIAPILLVIGVGIYISFKIYIDKTSNNNYGVDTKQLIVFKSFERYFFVPIYNFIRDTFILFSSSVYKYIFYLLLLLNYNVITIVIELVVYYFNFITVFEFVDSYAKFYKLCYYMLPIIRYFPVWIFIIIAFKYFNKLRYKRANIFRYHMDNRNKGVINRLPALYMIKGGPGSGKDFLGTDIALTREAMWKDNCKKMMFKYDTMFPKFDFLMLAKYVEYLYEIKSVKSLVELKVHFNAREAMFNIYTLNGRLYDRDREKAKDILFGYDYEKEIMEYCDGVKYISIFSVIKNYVQSYFIYLLDSTIISNYSVRQDNYKISLGNMVHQQTDYFAITPEQSRIVEHFSYIMNQDDFRLYKKVDENSRGTFEFGNVCWTEIDKDYGNMLDTENEKKDDINANSKNDGLNSHFKMIRSSATIDNNLFASVSGNAQRDMNIAINIRDISDILEIIEVHPVEYCFLFGNKEIKFFEWYTEKYKAFYEKFRFMRGDNTLIVYILKFIYTKLFNHYTRLMNEYGYKLYEIRSGNKEYKYYSFTKKMYANRYRTDVFSKFFNKKIYDSKTGILDMSTFKHNIIDNDEMKKVNSYFFNELYGLKKNSNNEQVNNNDYKGLSAMQKRLMRGGK